MRYIEKNISFNSLANEAQLLLNSSTHYNENDRVREIIRIIHYGCCSYCECSPEDGSFFHIEHFYPKNLSIYKKYEKSIENLHYSCQRCNSLKGSKVHLNIFSTNYYLDNHSNWHITNPYKIENELFYVGHLLFSNNTISSSIERGNETMKLFDLNNFNKANRSNREYLVESRLRVFESAIDIINVIYELLLNYTPSTNNAIKILFNSLMKYTNQSSHYSTMIIHNFGSDIHKLMLIYLKIKK